MLSAKQGGWWTNQKRKSLALRRFAVFSQRYLYKLHTKIFQTLDSLNMVCEEIKFKMQFTRRIYSNLIPDIVNNAIC